MQGTRPFLGKPRGDGVIRRTPREFAGWTGIPCRFLAAGNASGYKAGITFGWREYTRFNRACLATELEFKYPPQYATNSGVCAIRLPGRMRAKDGASIPRLARYVRRILGDDILKE